MREQADVVEKLVSRGLGGNWEVDQSGCSRHRGARAGLTRHGRRPLSLARLAMASGLPDVAKAALLSAIEAKKTPTACWLALGDFLWGTDKKAAKNALCDLREEGQAQGRRGRDGASQGAR